VFEALCKPGKLPSIIMMNDPWRDNNLSEENFELYHDNKRGVLRALFDFAIGALSAFFGLGLIASQILNFKKLYHAYIYELKFGSSFQIGYSSAPFILKVLFVMLGWYLCERGVRLIVGLGWQKYYKSGPSYWFDIKYPLIGLAVSIIFLMAIWILVKSA
jgi:hypothetical protein